MDFVPGAPLSQLREELKRRGIEIEPGSLAEQERPWGSPGQPLKPCKKRGKTMENYGKMMEK